MPLYKEWSPDAHSLAAIWKIEEPEAFFAAATGLTETIKHDKRRIERLAGRYLLQYLKEDFPLLHIYADAEDKPRIPADQYYFSISHSYPYIAAMVSDIHECGIDIQCWHPRMEALQHKFLSREEQLYFRNDTRLITLGWSIKEAAYKWLGRRGIEFIEQLQILSFDKEGNQYQVLLNAIVPESTRQQSITGYIEEEFSLAFTVN